jgi:hypothetical protein
MQDRQQHRQEVLAFLQFPLDFTESLHWHLWPVFSKDGNTTRRRLHWRHSGEISSAFITIAGYPNIYQLSHNN